MRNLKAYALIIDNRDGTSSKVSAWGEGLRDAHCRAFNVAEATCATRNEPEGWTRFVPILIHAPVLAPLGTLLDDDEYDFDLGYVN
jgi:hypothetical protein